MEGDPRCRIPASGFPRGAWTGDDRQDIRRQGPSRDPAVEKVHTWEVLKPFAKAVASAVAEFNPKRFLVKASLKQRAGKIYIDWLRNGKGATCVVPWGLRVRKTAPVSTPVNWDDLADVAQTGFHINEPFYMPDDWKNSRPQSITKLTLKYFEP